MPSGQSYPQIGQTVGPRLRAARLAKKYTQSQLASPDFSVSYISAIERGQIQPSLRALEIFALRLGTTSTDLLSTAPPGANGTAGIESTIQSEEEIELQFLEAQILIRQGAAQQAIIQLRNLTSSTLRPLQEIRLRYLLGWSYFSLALLEEGESVLAGALKLSKNSGEYLSLQILNLLGKIYSSMHNYAQGLEYHQLCLHRLEEEQQPQDAFFRAQVYTNMGLDYIYLDKFDEAIQMFHVPAAHTDGDTIVFFRRSDVVATGDLFVTTSYPIVDIDRGGNIQGVVKALNHILDITIPAEKQEAGTYVIPGHGRLCDEADVVEFRDMSTIIRDRIQDMVKKGMTLEQVKTAKPTRDYDPRYGAEKGFWTTDKFVEAVYKSLATKK